MDNIVFFCILPVSWDNEILDATMIFMLGSAGTLMKVCHLFLP